MPVIRGITISIGYSELLRITLVRNMRHMSECLVITSPEDADTQEVARSVPGVQLHVTTAHREHQARFNKGLAYETGWDVYGRHGQQLIWDADILFPDALPLDQLSPDTLYGARRRILEDPSKWRPDLVWTAHPLHHDGGPIGFFQLFSADAPCLKDRRPWYDVSFAHAGGGDAAFMNLFPAGKRTVLPIDVLHLGIPDTHWFGTDQEGIDMMARFVHENNWHRAKKHHPPESVARAGEPPHRVEVPGYPASTYELPFVARARTRKAP